MWLWLGAYRTAASCLLSTFGSYSYTHSEGLTELGEDIVRVSESVSLFYSEELEVIEQAFTVSHQRKIVLWNTHLPWGVEGGRGGDIFKLLWAQESIPPAYVDCRASVNLLRSPGIDSQPSGRYYDPICRTSPPVYTGSRNRSLGIDSWGT